MGILMGFAQICNCKKGRPDLSKYFGRYPIFDFIHFWLFFMVVFDMFGLMGFNNCTGGGILKTK